MNWLVNRGEQLELIAIDAHETLRRGAVVRLEPLPGLGLRLPEALPREVPIADGAEDSRPAWQREER